MIVKHNSEGLMPRSEIIVDYVEDAAVGEMPVGNATKVVEDMCAEVAESCMTAARYELISPSCYAPEYESLSLAEREAQAARIICGLTIDHERNDETQTVAVRAGCEAADCHLRTRASLDPGVIVINNAYPELVDNFRTRS